MELWSWPQSFLFQNNGQGVFSNVTNSVVPELEVIGNVTSAAWMQQPGKSLPDLVITGEWMSVHYFENQEGNLVKKTEDFGLNNFNGLWQSIKIADLNGDEYPNIILGNFGINSRLQASDESPLKLYVNDFNENGQTAPVIARNINGEEKPIEQLDEIIAQIPEVQEEIRSYHDYASKSLDEIFEPSKPDSALQKEIRELRSMILLNNGNGGFDPKPLPFEAQLFPVLAIHTGDFNNDGITDILLGGNLYDVKPSMGGRQDAGFGLVLTGNGNGEFEVKSYNETGFFVDGETRSIQSIEMADNRKHVIVARNNETLLIFRIKSADN